MSQQSQVYRSFAIAIQGVVKRVVDFPRRIHPRRLIDRGPCGYPRKQSFEIGTHLRESDYSEAWTRRLYRKPRRCRLLRSIRKIPSVLRPRDSSISSMRSAYTSTAYLVFATSRSISSLCSRHRKHNRPAGKNGLIQQYVLFAW